jgi:transposase-like protein
MAAEVRLYCPACTGPAFAIARGERRRTVRYECSRCTLRFSISADDVAKLAAAIADVAAARPPLRPDEAVMADG